MAFSSFLVIFSLFPRSLYIRVCVRVFVFYLVRIEHEPLLCWNLLCFSSNLLRTGERVLYLYI